MRAWVEYRGGESHDHDDRMPFSFVNVPAEDSLRWQNCMGLGLTGKISAKNVPTVREAELERLAERNSRLCDLVRKRAHGPPGFYDEDMLQPVQPANGRLGDRIRWYHTTLFPTCRAVMVIATMMLTVHKTVLLVLTGDYEHLRSGPPTLADIPADEIVQAHSDAVVEVKVSTAVWYLACLDAAEEAANEELRSLNGKRQRLMEQEFRREAEETTRKLADGVDGVLKCLPLGKVLEAVLGEENAEV